MNIDSWMILAYLVILFFFYKKEREKDPIIVQSAYVSLFVTFYCTKTRQFTDVSVHKCTKVKSTCVPKLEIYKTAFVLFASASLFSLSNTAL